MAFVPKPTRKKNGSVYKTIYLSKTLLDAVNEIANQYDTSFNNVVVSMIEKCLSETENEE